VKPEGAIGRRGEDAVEGERVSMHIELEPRAKTLDGRDAAPLAGAEPPPPGAAPVLAQDGPHEYPEDGATERVVEGEPVAEPVGHGEHPLAHGDGGEDRLHKMGGALGHAAATAARTDRACLAREGHEPLERAVVAAHAREAVDEQSAAEEAPELPGDEGGEPHPVGAGGGLREEFLQVLAHDAVEDGAVGGARDIGFHGTGRSGWRAGPGAGAWTRSATHSAPGV